MKAFDEYERKTLFLSHLLFGFVLPRKRGELNGFRKHLSNCNNIVFIVCNLLLLVSNFSKLIPHS